MKNKALLAVLTAFTIICLINNVYNPANKNELHLCPILAAMACRCRKVKKRAMDFASRGCLATTGYLPGETIKDRVIAKNCQEIDYMPDPDLTPAARSVMEKRCLAGNSRGGPCTACRKKGQISLPTPQ